MKLAELQAALFAKVTGDASAAPEEQINGGALTPAERVEVYAGMYVARTQDSLREDYPRLAALLGPDRLAKLTADYVKAWPSTHYSLSMLGQSLPKFLREAPRPEERADLADLAELEWAHASSFIAPDATVVELSALQAVDPGAFATVRLVPTPSVRLVWLEHDVLALWRALESEDGTLLPPLKMRHAMLVWRKQYEVFHVVIDKQEAAAFEALLAGKPIGEACEAFATREEPAQAAFAAIASWVNEGMIAAVVPSA